MHRRATDPGSGTGARVRPLPVLSVAVPLGLALCLLLALPFLLHYHLEETRARQHALDSENRVLELAQQAAVQEVASVLSDLRFLHEQNEMRDLLRGDAPGARERLAAEYLTFVSQKPRYEQAAVIGADGGEVVRVDGNDGRPTVAGAPALQWKGDCAHFQETMRLGRGEVHLSPLDLILQGGAVQMPLKPVLRASVALFGAGGERRGVLTLSYHGRRLLTRLRAYAQGGASQLWLLNEQGYWLAGPDPALEWGFAFPERSDRTLAAREPEAWERIRAEVAGTVDTADGLLTFRRVYPLAGDASASDAPAMASPHRYSWTLATLLPHAALSKRMAGLAGTLLAVYGVTAPLLFGGTLWLTYRSARGRARLREAQRRERERMLELAHANRLASVGEMATQMAHQVNQPLTAIVTYCAAAQRSLQSGAGDLSRLREWVDAIGEEAQRVSAIVRGLREFVRRGKMAPVPLDLGEVVAGVVGALRPDADRRRVKLGVETPAGLPAVLADRVLVAQALLNLVRNAIEAVSVEPSERRRVVVSLALEGDRVVVSVADTGPGVDPGLAGRLFESFVTTKPEGLGMGLSITRSIVEAHGGQLRYDPAPSGGAVFSFSLRRSAP